MYEDYNNERKAENENVIDVTQSSSETVVNSGNNSAYTSYSSASGSMDNSGTDYGRTRYGSYTSDRGSYTSNAGSTGNNNANRYTQYQFSSGAVPPVQNKPEKKKGGFFKKFAAAVALGLVFGACAGAGLFAVNMITGANQKSVEKAAVTAPATTAPATSSVNTTEAAGKIVTTAKAAPAIATTGGADVSSVAENSMPAVVAITNNYTYYTQDWFGQKYKGESEASGSGIIVGKSDTELFIATNQHVVSSADSLTVQFIDETTSEATLKSQDTSADIAVIAVPISSLSAETLDNIKIITLADPSTIKVGQQVVAIGNALGYGQSVTTGVISAMDREVVLSNGTHKLIQTDAAINPGNSGGALLDMNGYLIGINEAKLSGGGIEGMGYAIPISVAQPIIDKLMTKDVQENHGYLGISGANVTDEVSKTYNMPKGVYVSKAEKGLAAANAGIKKGDIITYFDGQQVTSMTQLQELLQYYGVGESVEVKYNTQSSDGYEEKTTTVTLTEFPEAQKEAEKNKKKEAGDEEEESEEAEEGEEEESEDGVTIKQFDIDSIDDLFRMFGN